MRKIIFILAALLCTNSYANKSAEEQLAEAQKALEIAAKRIAELHAKGYQHEGPKRAMLGVLLDSESMVGGVPISGTTPKGGAVQAGLEAGDKIVEIDGIDLRREDNALSVLSKHMKSKVPGDEVPVVYVRDGKEVAASITTQARSAHVKKMIRGFSDNSDFDFDFDFDFDGVQSIHKVAVGPQHLMSVTGDLADYFDVDEGVVVTATGKDSELKGGDVLLEVNDVEIESVNQTVKLLADLDDAVPAKIKRKGRTRTVELNPHNFHGSVNQEVKVITITDND